MHKLQRLVCVAENAQISIFTDQCETPTFSASIKSVVARYKEAMCH